jgi:hypothetical protein
MTERQLELEGSERGEGEGRGDGAGEHEVADEDDEVWRYRCAPVIVE